MSPRREVFEDEERIQGAATGEISPGGENLEMRVGRKMKRKSSHDSIDENVSSASADDVPAAKSQRLGNAGTQSMDTPPAVARGIVTMETEVVGIVYDKPEGRSLGFTVCGGQGDRDGESQPAIYHKVWLLI